MCFLSWYSAHTSAFNVVCVCMYVYVGGVCVEMSVYEWPSDRSFIPIFPLQFFTFEQYKKLLNLTPLSPGVVSIKTQTPEHALTWKINRHTHYQEERYTQCQKSTIQLTCQSHRLVKQRQMPRLSLPAKWIHVNLNSPVNVQTSALFHVQTEVMQEYM